MNPATIVIKKYPNRRLYDTSASRYINLEDIGEMVRKGKDVQVVDAQSGADVTRVTLTQIIVDDAKQQPTGLPLELLRQLIVSSDEVGREFIMWYLKSAFDAYQGVQSKLHSGLSEMQSAAMSPISMLKNFMQRPACREPGLRGAKRCEHGTTAVTRAHCRTGGTCREAQAEKGCGPAQIREK